jgi:hypothetical protein
VEANNRCRSYESAGAKDIFSTVYPAMNSDNQYGPKLSVYIVQKGGWRGTYLVH